MLPCLIERGNSKEAIAPSRTFDETAKYAGLADDKFKTSVSRAVCVRPNLS